MESARELMKKKDEIESDISLQLKILETNGNIGMDGPLIDKQGYPRSDIDIYEVRKARNRIICLRNDHKALMKEIEQNLYSIHAEAKEKGTSYRIQLDPSHDQPQTFASVTMVTEGSPSYIAGLRVGDRLVEFGSVKFDNFTGLANISIVVQHSVGRPVRVVVLRDGKSTVVISLVPQQWSGRGLLGCVIVPS